MINNPTSLILSVTFCAEINVCKKIKLIKKAKFQLISMRILEIPLREGLKKINKMEYSSFGQTPHPPTKNWKMEKESWKILPKPVIVCCRPLGHFQKTGK